MAFGDLPGDVRRERSLRGKRILNPGEGFISEWINRYTLSLFPFAVGVTAIRVIPANPLRCYLLVQNKSAGDIFINFGQSPTAFTGIRIDSGGSYSFEGGGVGGGFSPVDDIYVLGSAAGLEGVAAEGLWQPSSK